MKTRRSLRRSPARRSRSTFVLAVLVSAFFSFSASVYALGAEFNQFASLKNWVDQSLSVVRAESARLVGSAHSQVSQVESVSASGNGSPRTAYQTNFSECPQFFVSGHFPEVPQTLGLRELCYGAFAILHSGMTKTPVFVAQRLNRRMLQQAQRVKRVDRFYEEARLPARERAQLSDYRGSGYSRGHMAPAADMHHDEAMAQSFSLANMVPQDQKHNAGAWAQIEQDTRKYVSRAAGDVYIFTGPVYDSNPSVIGKGRVAVPKYLYKVVYDAQTQRAWVHWHANDPSTKVGKPMSYGEFVKRTGLHLIPERTVKQ